MKLFNAIAFVVKTMLSIAGIVMLVNKLKKPKSGVGYNFTTDTTLNKDRQKTFMRSSSGKKRNFADLQESYFQSMDFPR